MSATSEELQDINISGSSRQVCERLSVEATMRRYHTSLLRFLRRRLRVEEDAADIAQEAYLRMLQYDGSNKINSPVFRNLFSHNRSVRPIAFMRVPTSTHGAIHRVSI